jgi:hypothetical protein
MNKIAIITSLIGNRERISQPVVVHPNVDYFAFTDQSTDGTIWQKKEVYSFSEDTKYAGRRNAKIYKILPELFVPGYDFYFWADVSHDVVANPYEVCETFMKDGLYGNFRHTQRSCIYREAEVLKELNYDHHDNIDKQISYYKSIGYPENNGLWELSVFIKKNTPETRNLSLKWWDHICRFASRDQLSFPVCLWKCGITPVQLPGFANGFNSHGGYGNNPIMPQTRVHVGSGG